MIYKCERVLVVEKVEIVTVEADSPEEAAEKAESYDILSSESDPDESPYQDGDFDEFNVIGEVTP